MSRSYRKHVEISKDPGGPYRKFAKKMAKRKVRRTKDIPDGKAYRKVYCSWEICDYRGWWSISEELRSEIKFYAEILRKEEEGQPIWRHEKRRLNRGFPTYEKVYKERRRYGR